MPYNKKKILTVFYWFISVIVEAFIAITIMNAIYMYVFIYKEEYWSIILTIVYTVLGIAVITFKRFKENKNLLQFKPFKFSTVIKISLELHLYHGFYSAVLIILRTLYKNRLFIF